MISNDSFHYYQVPIKSEKPINITGLDKNQLKRNCINGSIVNCIREPISYSFALANPPGHKSYKEPKIKLSRKTKKSVLLRIRFYFEDDDHKPVDFNGETIIFNCQTN